VDFVAQTLSLPDQLRWAAGTDIPDLDPAPAVLVAGMGGSGISGDFAAVLAEAEGRRLHVTKEYGLPRWAEAERPLVVAVSYSGNTEETLTVAVRRWRRA
jgi:fructoselysine-6-P-deglycase FrlB-like protein